MASTQEITSKQRKLLEQYYQIYDPHSAEDTRQLLQIRGEYNHLAGEIERRKPSSGLSDPLEVLPPELLLNCFYDLFQDHPEGVFSLLRVSKRWWSFLRSATSLWTKIRVRNGGTNIRRVQTCLTLSQTSPLIIEVVLQPQWTESWSDLFTGHSHRIREIRFRHHSFYEGDYFMREQLFRSGLRSLRKLGPLSSLETLEYSNNSIYPHLITDGSDLPEMPALRHLLGFRITASALNRGIINLRTLTQFATESPLYEISPHFSKLHRLEHLELCEPAEETVVDIEVYDVPSLKTLAFDRGELLAIRPILRARGGNLVNLYLRLAWNDLSDVRFLETLPCLEHLRIYCPMRDPVHDTAAIVFPVLPRMREFHFIQKPGIYDQTYMMSTKRLSSLFKALAHSMPSLQTLNLAFFESVPVCSLLDFLTILDQLKSLDFKYDYLDLTNVNQRITLPLIKSLRLCNEMFLRFVDLPSLTCLWIDTVASDGSPSDLPLPATGFTAGPLSDSDAVYVGRFGAVRDLIWDGAIPHGSSGRCSILTTAFTNIRELTFAQAYARKDSNDFCEMLLRYPASCPLLEKISFHCYPSWDLVFHMLLRRNFMPGSPVVTIRTIQLPNLPSPALLTPITHLLSGRLTAIPRLFDIALTFKNGLFDYTVSGCDCCLDCGLSCSSEVQVIDSEVHLPDQQPLLLEQPQPTTKGGNHSEQQINGAVSMIPTPPPLENSPLIEPLKTWFDGWPERRRVWNTYSEAWGSMYRRTFACGKHDFIHLVTITPSDGVSDL